MYYCEVNLQAQPLKYNERKVMGAITRIDIKIKTGDRSGAGTDGDVYLAIGGREFYIDSAADDFERGNERVYTLGSGANINFAGDNDPQQPHRLVTEDLDAFPIWVRFEPSGNAPDWNLEEVHVTVNPGPYEIEYNALVGGSNNLWLGNHMGKFCFLKKATGSL